ncbi:MAG: glycosyltransferase family 9 protein [Desulfonatronovibrio sp.]
MPFKRIGVWQTAFLGDAVLTLPLLQNLAEQYPESEIHFFVRKGLKSLFAGNSRYNVHEFDKYGQDKGITGILKAAAKIKKIKFDLWISPHTSLRSTLTALLNNSPQSIGYSHPLLNKLVYKHTVYRKFYQLDEIERLLELLKPLQISAAQNWPRLVLPGRDLEQADEFWKKRIPGKTLGIHPGSTWPTKMWPEQYFTRIINMAGQIPDLKVLVFAGPGEEEVTNRILAGIDRPDNVINLAGKLTLPRLAAFLGKLDCYLTNDSGPMHLAWTQNTPLIALFGPTVKKLGFFPRGKNSTVLESDLSCRPCGLHGHRSCPEKHHRCMMDITPETVIKHIRKKIDA